MAKLRLMAMVAIITIENPNKPTEDIDPDLVRQMLKAGIEGEYWDYDIKVQGEVIVGDLHEALLRTVIDG